MKIFNKRLILILSILLIGIAKGQDCTAADNTEGVELWGECYSINNTTYLNLDNTGINDTIPATIGNLVNLVDLRLNRNGLYGSIPSEIGGLVNLERLYLMLNELSGVLPSELFSLTSLKDVRMSHNQFSGSLSSSIGNLGNLEYLGLSYNNFSGQIPPEIGSLVNLESFLFLSNNNFTGSIPPTIVNLIFLERLKLNNNQLSGTLPIEISSMVNLKELILNSNQLSGELPLEIGSLDSLEFLSLYQNQFSGIIPDTICNLNAGLSLSENQFCPPYPQCFDEEYINQIGLNNQNFSNCSGCEVHIVPLENQQILEDSSFITEISTYSGQFVSSVELFVSNDLTFFCSLEDGIFTIMPELNWNGTITASIYAINNFNVSDTSTFTIDVLSVNDSPEPFSLIYPTITDTISIHTDTDEIIQFNWEESVDVDSEVSYITTVTLDYFGETYTDTYESSEPMVEVSPYEWAVLMTNLELERWTLEYTVQASDEEYTVESEGEFVFQNNTLSVENDITPLSFRLHQNYPNPFNPITTVRYELPEDSFVDVTVYDMLGNVVNNLVNTNQSSGYKSVQWNATNNQGGPVSAGVYLYKIQAGDFVDTKKMILLK